MEYKILHDREGELIHIDDLVSFSYIEETEGGDVISSSDDLDFRPALMFRERSAFRGDLFAALGLLSEGDKAVFKINRDSVVHFSGRSVIPAGKYLVYRVVVHKVITRGGLSDSLFNRKIEAFRASEISAAQLSEAAKIKTFVTAQDVDKSCVSGLKYKIMKKGIGERALPGDTIEVDYTASYLNGKPFETTHKKVAQQAEVYNPLLPYKPMALTISDTARLSGFEEAMLLFPKGTEALLVIPSALAYGAQGNGVILPYTPIACTIKISDIKFQRK